MELSPFVIPLCFDCKHFSGLESRSMACAAFPGGIPTPILLLEADHRDPYPGDNGIQFEAKPPAPETETGGNDES